MSYWTTLEVPGIRGENIFFHQKIDFFITPGRVRPGWTRQTKRPKWGRVGVQWDRPDASRWVLGVRERSGGRYMSYWTPLEVPGIRGENFFHQKIDFFITPGRVRPGWARQTKRPKWGRVGVQWDRPNASRWVLGVRERSGGRYMSYWTPWRSPGFGAKIFFTKNRLFYHPRSGPAGPEAEMVPGL